MAKVEKRISKDGTVSYRVQIRKKNNEIYKSFRDEETAKLFIFYKEALIENMKNFEVPLEKRISFNHIIELKMKNLKDKRSVNEFKNILVRFNNIFPENKFYDEISYEDWLGAAKSIYSSPVYLGGKNGTQKRNMSPLTLRRIFATVSSAISYAKEQGLNLENHPIKVVQNYINPLIR